MKIVIILLFGLIYHSTHAEIPDNFRLLDKFVEDCMAKYRIPGLALGVIEGNKVVFLKGYGIADPTGRQVTPQTPFYIGSVTKSFTAMAVLQLVEDGSLDLDTPITKYIPWFSMKEDISGNRASDRITLRHLLYHTSGIAKSTGQTALTINYEKPDALERQIRSFASSSLIHEPGNYYEYANANYQIAGLVVQVVSGNSIENFFKEQIFKPLNMMHSHTSPGTAHNDGMATGYRWWFGFPIAFRQQPFPRGCFPSGHIISTVEDLSHFLIAQMNNGRYREVTVLSHESMSMIYKPGVNHYALGWNTVRNGSIQSSGHLECFGTHLYIDTKNQRGIALLFNVNRGFGYEHLYKLTPAISKLLSGKVVSIPPINQNYRASMLQLLGVFMAIGIWLIWSLCQLRKWTKGTSRGLQSRKLWLFLLLPLSVECLLVVVLIKSITVDFSVAFLHSPDTMWLWLFVISVTVVWGLIRTLWAIKLVIHQR